MFSPMPPTCVVIRNTKTVSLLIELVDHSRPSRSGRLATHPHVFVPLLLAHLLQQFHDHHGLRENKHFVLLLIPGLQDLLESLEFAAAHDLAVVLRDQVREVPQQKVWVIAQFSQHTDREERLVLSPFLLTIARSRIAAPYMFPCSRSPYTFGTAAE